MRAIERGRPIQCERCVRESRIVATLRHVLQIFASRIGRREGTAGNGTFFRGARTQSGKLDGGAGHTLEFDTVPKAAISAVGVAGWREPPGLNWGNLPRPGPWLPYVFTSPKSWRKQALGERAKCGASDRSSSARSGILDLAELVTDPVERFAHPTGKRKLRMWVYDQPRRE
jgi:hypothetical protein